MTRVTTQLATASTAEQRGISVSALIVEFATLLSHTRTVEPPEARLSVVSA